MTLALIILHVIVCLILILVILLQAGRGQGLTGPAFGSDVDTLFGTRTADFLTKATSVAAICFLVTCIALDYIEAQKSRSLLEIPSQKVPLDLDQIKKALEKVKREPAGAGTTPSAETKTEAPKETPPASAPAPVEPNAASHPKPEKDANSGP